MTTEPTPPAFDASSDPAEPIENGNREAQKYRLKLREVEAERDQLREKVTGWQKSHAETLAEKEGLKPAALWASGADLASLLDDEGRIDAAALSTAVQHAKTELGIPSIASAPSSDGQGSTGKAIVPADEVNWGTALKSS